MTVLTLQDRLASLVTGMGYEFVGCEWGGSLLRVYIDTEKGVTLDDCTRVSRQISAMLDVEDPIQGKYTLEISSPGLDRPLFEMKHYQQQLGKKIKIKLHSPIQERKNWVGVLKQVEPMNIILLVDAEEIVVPFAAIEKGRVCE